MKKEIITILMLFGLSTISVGQEAIQTIPPRAFAFAIQTDTNAVVIDVRTATEYAEKHLHGAISIDYLQTERFDNAIQTLSKEKTYYIYCRSGKRSHSASQKMQQKGLRVMDLQGGMIAWVKEGLPTESNTP